MCPLPTVHTWPARPPSAHVLSNSAYRAKLSTALPSKFAKHYSLQVNHTSQLSQVLQQYFLKFNRIYMTSDIPGKKPFGVKDFDVIVDEVIQESIDGNTDLMVHFYTDETNPMSELYQKGRLVTISVKMAAQKARGGTRSKHVRPPQRELYLKYLDAYHIPIFTPPPFQR